MGCLSSGTDSTLSLHPSLLPLQGPCWPRTALQLPVPCRPRGCVQPSIWRHIRLTLLSSAETWLPRKPFPTVAYHAKSVPWTCVHRNLYLSSVVLSWLQTSIWCLSFHVTWRHHRHVDCLLMRTKMLPLTRPELTIWVSSCKGSWETVYLKASCTWVLSLRKKENCWESNDQEKKEITQVNHWERTPARESRLVQSAILDMHLYTYTYGHFLVYN